jgi:hypothetical protein
MPKRDKLVKRMTTPPLSPEVQPPRTSYDAFTEVFTDLKQEADTTILTNAERAKELWDGTNPDV